MGENKAKVDNARMDPRERWYRELLQAVASHLEGLAAKHPELGRQLGPVAQRIRQRLFEGPPNDAPPRGPAEYLERKRRGQRR